LLPRFELCCGAVGLGGKHQRAFEVVDVEEAGGHGDDEFGGADGKGVRFAGREIVVGSCRGWRGRGSGGLSPRMRRRVMLVLKLVLML